MALVDLWVSSRSRFDDKHVEQIIAFAGDGKLLDRSEASLEFRSFLTEIPSGLLARYSEQCLTEAFTNSGFALQDIVNQVGKRLGLQVTDGRYRGSTTQVSFDGLWLFPSRHAVIVEVRPPTHTESNSTKSSIIVGAWFEMESCPKMRRLQCSSS